MAKKTNRMLVHLVCEKCREQNYTTKINKINTKVKEFKRMKFCPRCRTKVLHKTSTKMK